ncbi:uncharacterized protein LOC136032062 isoform X3 [Artemia franciscana]|uniref:uncharacterized protein LOC136032062 isoform X3 n=1 Tax=Artemia franciscana TaxID=6661 RepID=UPI0032DAF033
MRKLLKICFILIIILGQMLVNWLLIELDEVNYQRHSLVQLEVRQPIINFYTMLLLAGVIRPVEDGNINGVDMDFERLMSCESVSKPTKPGSCKNLDANRLWHCSKKDVPSELVLCLQAYQNVKHHLYFGSLWSMTFR